MNFGGDMGGGQNQINNPKIFFWGREVGNLVHPFAPSQSDDTTNRLAGNRGGMHRAAEIEGTAGMKYLTTGLLCMTTSSLYDRNLRERTERYPIVAN